MPLIVGMLFDDDDTSSMMKIDEYYSILNGHGLDIRIMFISTKWQEANEFSFLAGKDEISWAINFILNGTQGESFALIDTRLSLDISELFTSIKRLPEASIGKGFIFGSKQDYACYQDTKLN